MKTRKTMVMSALAAASVLSGAVVGTPVAHGLIRGGDGEFYTGERDNVTALAAGSGIVNCENGEACIDPETHVAQVEFQVQAGIHTVMSSHDDHVAGNGVSVAIPKDVRNVKVRLDTFTPSEETARRLGIARETIDVSSELPVYVSHESTLSGEPGYSKFASQHSNEILYDERFADVSYFLHNAPVSLASFEDTVSSRETALLASGLPYNGDVDQPLTFVDRWGETNEYTTRNAELYNYVTTTAGKFQGIYTYTITGEVHLGDDVAEDADLYLPYRTEQNAWRCFQSGVDVGSYGSGCVSLKDDYLWARTGDLPYYNLRDKAANADLARRRVNDGLSGSANCAVTRDVDDPAAIGADVTPRNLYDRVDFRISSLDDEARYNAFIEAGYEFDAPYSPDRNEYRIVNDKYATGSFAEMYARVQGLETYTNTTLTVSGYGVNEDGCDQAVIKLTWCPKDEPTPVTNTVTATATATATRTHTATATATTTVIDPPKNTVARCVARNMAVIAGAAGVVAVPVALMSQLQMPGVTDLTNQLAARGGSDFAGEIAQRIQRANDDLQHGLGVYNDDIRRSQEAAARDVARIQRELGIYNESAARVISESNLPAIAGGVAASAAVGGVGIYTYNQCVKDVNFRIFDGVFGNTGSSTAGSYEAGRAATAMSTTTTTTVAPVVETKAAAS